MTTVDLSKQPPNTLIKYIYGKIIANKRSYEHNKKTSIINTWKTYQRRNFREKDAIKKRNHK